MRPVDPAGRCDFLDVLEEAAHFKQSVRLELRDGATVQADVRDVVTESGEDYVILAGHERIRVSDIVRCRPSADRERRSYDDKL
jgi:Rho-binding antiterminator